ncbi:MAG TPA: hypothetical protein VH724_02930 [Candidatus Angelobacter sp.]|nr:hypothetical protein [Candidatus Angelobacter sp.]
MTDPKRETLRAAPSEAAPTAKKVRSSRYEWENKSGESEPKPDARPPQRSLLAALGAGVKKFFSAGRGLFDNDDDASPSAA